MGISQVNWWIVVLSTALGHPWLGLAAVGVGVAIHAHFLDKFPRELGFLMLAAAIGACADSFLGLAGLIAYPNQPGTWIARPFMLALWVNFAISFPLGLRWLSGRYALAASLGAVGGSAAYLAGTKFAVLEFTQGAISGVGVAACWAVAVPVLLCCRKALGLDQALHCEAAPPPAKANNGLCSVLIFGHWGQGGQG